MQKNDHIVFYPSNWLYNAGVVGFLKTLEEFENTEEGKFEFTSDGRVIIPLQVFIRDSNSLPTSIKALIKKYIIKEYSEKELGDSYIQLWGKLFASNAPYQNLVQRKEWEEYRFIELIEEIVKNLNSKDLTCGFCKKKNISQEWFEKKGKTLEKRITILAHPHTADLGASIGEFPNAFWNNKNSIFICPLCVFMLIHHKFSFIPFNDSEIFINTPNFKLTYDLNKFFNAIRTYKEYEIEKLLGSTFLQWAIKRKTLLGAWTIMNIEVIIKRKKPETVVDYFDLPFHITRILLDPEIASLIDKIGEEKIFDLIIKGNFSELEKVNYYVLKTILKLHNKEKVSENDPIREYIGNHSNLEHLYKISTLIPQLYTKILKVLKAG